MELAKFPLDRIEPCFLPWFVGVMRLATNHTKEIEVSDGFKSTKKVAVMDWRAIADKFEVARS